MSDTTETASAASGAESPDEFSTLRAGLPEELRGHPALASYTSLEGLARSHVAAQRMVGKRIEDASPEELGRHYARHGRPEKPEAYDFGASPGADGGATAQQGELERSARAWFHDAGLSQRQAEVLYRNWNDFAAAQARDSEITAAEGRAQAERELRSEWGRIYDRKVATASRAVAEFGGEALAAYLDETGLGNDPRLIRAFARIAELVGEDSLVGEGDRQGDFSVNPDAARGEIARTLRNPAYFDANHPEHASIVDRMRGLFAAAYPEMPR